MSIGRARAGIAAAALIVATANCGIPPEPFGDGTRVPTHGSLELPALARRFAPVLRLHPDEPYGVDDVMAVFHPARATVGYHVLFQADVVRPRGGKRLDHEIVWVRYDPVTLKVVDVATYWHRTVLRTEECVADAQRSEQRPTIDVQWGQHGLLPLGWEKLRTVRPRLELFLYYGVVRHGGGTVLPTPGKRVAFRGTYEDYLRFSESVDLASLIDDEAVAVSANPETALAGRVDGDFAHKKHWPDE